MNEKMNGGISTMRGIFCRLPFQKGGITEETIAAQGFDSGIFSVDTRQKPSQTYRLRRFFLYGQQYREHLRGENHPAMTYFSPLKAYPAPFVLRRCRRDGFRHPMYFAKYASTSFI